MSAEIVNLRKALKARDRADKQKRAEENRVKFGRTKAERDLATADKSQAARRLESHKRERNEPDGDDGCGGAGS
jgi:hypothetical protein